MSEGEFDRAFLSFDSYDKERFHAAIPEMAKTLIEVMLGKKKGKHNGCDIIIKYGDKDIFQLPTVGVKWRK